MRKEELFELIGDVDENEIEEAAAAGKKVRKRAGIKWGVMAACLCLVVGGIFAVRYSDMKRGAVLGGVAAGAGEPAGQWPEGVDPVIASLAVYPAGEKLENVENATIESISETETYEVDGLGNYLPTQLPEGYYFNRAYLYETTMKDGTKYYLLRVTYAEEGNPLPSIMNGDTGEEMDGGTDGDSFDISIWNHRPKTDQTIYTMDSLPQNLTNDGIFHISYEDVYISVTPLGISSEDILAVLHSITG